MSNNTISIFIVGDVVTTPTNEQFFRTGDFEALVHAENFEFFNQSYVSTINLECPIKTYEYCINKLNPTVVGLVNNHIMDFGEKGLSDTVSLLSQKVIPLNCDGNDFSDVLRLNYLLVKVFGSDLILVYNSTESIND